MLLLCSIINVVVNPLFTPGKKESLLWSRFLLTSSSGVICSVGTVLDFLPVCLSFVFIKNQSSLAAWEVRCDLYN